MNVQLKRKARKKIKPVAPRLTTQEKRSEGKRLGMARKPAKVQSNAQTLSKSNSGTLGKHPGASEKKLKAKDKELAGLNAKVQEMAGHIELLEKERTFYYSKLRSIEIMLQVTIFE